MYQPTCRPPAFATTFTEPTSSSPQATDTRSGGGKRSQGARGHPQLSRREGTTFAAAAKPTRRDGRGLPGPYWPDRAQMGLGNSYCHTTAHRPTKAATTRTPRCLATTTREPHRRTSDRRPAPTQMGPKRAQIWAEWTPPASRTTTRLAANDRAAASGAPTARNARAGKERPASASTAWE